ncbi:hypothetical protein CDAR_472861 [Caerostris darwini]|uniref:Uncharacterized protein n=1 Tax=Caerostris darwini TaxID=1538125 RepID=A0AAV4V914_9ARAC|nr:hypothetical protein CDAR_472861 [Caerostris darwini]
MSKRRRFNERKKNTNKQKRNILFDMIPFRLSAKRYKKETAQLRWNIVCKQHRKASEAWFSGRPQEVPNDIRKKQHNSSGISSANSMESGRGSVEGLE